MKPSTLITPLFCSILLLPRALIAHGSAPPPGTASAPNATGGTAQPATQTIRLDMKVAAQKIALYVTDQYEQPVDIGVGSATAFVVIKGSTTMLTLLPEDDNVLSAVAFFASDPDMQVHVTLRLPGRRPINQSFTPLKK